uniref:Uncharacterized protein n=1 Tax=Cannabis sativa TaxID=3483 RepID=A0A803QRJ9_CANSA
GLVHRMGKKRSTNPEAPSDVNTEPPKRHKKTTVIKKRASQTANLEVPETETHDLILPPAPARTDKPTSKTTQ